MYFFCVACTLQSALESEQKAWIVKFDFSAAFGRVNHQGILLKAVLCGYFRFRVVSIDTVSVKSIIAGYGAPCMQAYVANPSPLLSILLTCSLLCL